MIELEIAKVLKLHTDIICTRVRARWGSMSTIVGKEEIHSNLPVIVGTTIIASIESSGMAAFIKEFGSGHLLDPSSPYFAEYKNSPMWNNARTSDGNEFVGRSAGATVYRPDGSTSTSTGKAEGMRLEHQLGNLPAYKAFSPSHTIQHEVSAELPEIILHLQQVIEAHVLAEMSMEVQIYI